MELCQDRRGSMRGMDYLSEDRVELHYQLPLARDRLRLLRPAQSRTRGYASLDYQESGEQSADLVKVDILLNGDRVDAFKRDRAPRRCLQLRPAYDEAPEGTHPSPAV